MKQDEHLQELAYIKLALAVLSVQLDALAARRSGPFSVAPADPADRQEFRTTSCARHETYPWSRMSSAPHRSGCISQRGPGKDYGSGSPARGGPVLMPLM